MSSNDSRAGSARFSRAIVRHYFETALRSASRGRSHAAVCLVGLIVGISSALLIAIYLVDELSYDRWIPGHERVVQLTMGPVGERTLGAAPSDIGLWVRSDLPNVEAVTRLFRENVTLGRNAARFAEVVTWADPSFFDVLPLPVIGGDRATALVRPDSVVLTRSTAMKLFGTVDVVGELVELNSQSMTVTAVLEDLPSNTHLDIDILAPSHAPFSTAAEQDRNPLTYFTGKAWLAVTYVRLPPSLSVAEFRQAMPGLLDRRTAPGSPSKVSESVEITVRPIATLHLTSGMPDALVDLRSVFGLATVAALIVAAASINFVNLMTARAAARAVEIGVRKSLGATRRDLVLQFMTEAALYVGLATIVSLALIATLLLPALNTFMLRSIELGGLAEPRVVLGLIAFVVFVGLLAGAYPSLVLSRFPAITVLRTRALRGGGLVREALIVAQFSVLVALLIGTAVIGRQVTFAIDEALGDYSDPIFTLTTSCPAPLKNELRALPGVEGVACSNGLPQWGIGPSTMMRGRDGELRAGVYYAAVDFGLFELYGKRPVAGRFFVEDIATDAVPADNDWRWREAVVLNESAVELLDLGSPAEAVGELLAWRRLFRSPSTFTRMHDVEVIGVVEDFQTGRVNESGVRPAAFYVDAGQATSLSAKLRGGDLAATRAKIEEVWQRVGDPRPMQGGFFDESIEYMYRDLTRQQRIFEAFASVVVFIALLGLLGLVVHTAERRTKEVAVRRILGGKRLDIIALLLWQFSRPVLCAVAIAWPIAYIAASAWLAEFARRVDLDAPSFLLPAAATLLFALLIVVAHAAVMLRRQPVTALRYE